VNPGIEHQPKQSFVHEIGEVMHMATKIDLAQEKFREAQNALQAGFEDYRQAVRGDGDISMSDIMETVDKIQNFSTIAEVSKRKYHVVD
jgi:hypothetical protein